MKKRARDLGLPFPGVTGKHNALTDIAGVCIGTTTLIEGGDGPLVQGVGPVRTGVTAILPHGHERSPVPVWAGQFSLNGNGEMTGSHWIRDAGYFLGPICITNSHSVGVVHHAAVRWMINHYDLDFREYHIWAMPVVSETYDGVLNDINGQHVTEVHALEALNSAKPGPVAEGNTGGGTGMICYEFKGGTGTSSRIVEIGGTTHTVAALVQANHGVRDWFTVLGAPVGRHLTGDRLTAREFGSIIVIIGTDAPLRPDQLERLARRGSIGIGRGGTPGGNNSGDIFLAFSTANRTDLPQLSGARQALEYVNDEYLDDVYGAVVQAIEESVVNAMVAAEDMTMLKPAGKICRAVDADRLVELVVKR